MNVSATSLQDKIREGIPVADKLDFTIVSLGTDYIEVQAPLSLNYNVHGTAFAGSIYAIGVLTAWALTWHQIENAGMEAELVVASAKIQYRKPITEDISCYISLDRPAAEVFVRKLKERGTAKLKLSVMIGDDAARLDALMHARQAPA